MPALSERPRRRSRRQSALGVHGCLDLRRAGVHAGAYLAHLVERVGLGRARRQVPLQICDFVLLVELLPIGVRGHSGLLSALPAPVPRLLECGDNAGTIVENLLRPWFPLVFVNRRKSQFRRSLLAFSFPYPLPSGVSLKAEVAGSNPVGATRKHEVSPLRGWPFLFAGDCFGHNSDMIGYLRAPSRGSGGWIAAVAERALGFAADIFNE